MSTVHLDAAGRYTVTAGTSTDTYATLREALDAALPVVATYEKPATLRNPDSGALNGAWRWLPATDVEPVAVGGVRIDATAIEEMAASLNSRPGPVPIDGGPTPAGMLPSEVHGTAFTGGGTLANGWAHWGVVVAGPSESDAKLYLYAELVPEVARELDAGRMATGSVHFGYATLDGETPRGVELISHALTNDPAVKTLAPANSVRNGAPLTVRRGHQLAGGVMRARAKRNRPMKTSIATASNLRGPALDKLTQICVLLGIDVNAEIDAECWESPTEDAISLLKRASELEKVLAGAPASPVAASAAARADGVPPPAAPAAEPATQRAPVAGLADEAAKDAWITQVMTALTTAGLGDGTDAGASLEALSKAADKIKGAMSADAAAPADPGAAQMGAERSRDHAELLGLRAAVAELQKRVKDADERDALASDSAWFDAEVAKRSTDKLPFRVSDEDRSRVFSSRSALGAKWREDIALVYLSARHQPPTGTVMPDSMDERGGNDAAMTVSGATDACMEEARKSAGKNEPKHITRGRAQDIARQRYPGAFNASADEV